MKHKHAPVVVVGSGIAGMTTALAAAPMNVLLLCRAMGGSGSASALAQGGIAAALGQGDSAAAHTEDTLRAGAQYNDAGAVRWLTSVAPQTIGWLESQGVAFDRATDGRLQLGREGGHSAARIVHAGGDATGAMVVRVLRERIDGAAHIQSRGGVDVEALLLRGSRVAGVRTRDTRGRHEEIEAAAVVLATGGIGALFAHTTNPPGANGAGLALAMAAGARTRDLEFVQFHPTALHAGEASLPLLTEALRGAGARLIDDDGQLLMHGLHPLGDLAPRDVVARRVWQVQQEGGRALLDATAVPGDWNMRFPTVLSACRAHGFDPRREPVPVTPAAHFHMGGVAADPDGRTSLAGLYVVGEVACNGVHGANRLASNSLLEGVACGRRLGIALSGASTPYAHGAYRWAGLGTPLPAESLPALQDLMWGAAGPVRKAAVLHNAWRACSASVEAGWQTRLAAALLRAACVRRGSLGAHFRDNRVCAA